MEGIIALILIRSILKELTRSHLLICTIFSYLTQKTLSKTLQYAAAWQKTGRAIPFSVNLSAQLLSDVDLPDRIEDELRKVGIALPISL